MFSLQMAPSLSLSQSKNYHLSLWNGESKQIFPKWAHKSVILVSQFVT